jgi:hypothetical protein
MVPPSPELGMSVFRAKQTILPHEPDENTMTAQLSALRVATRIHFFLLRELGQGIDIEQMLNRELYARDVLLVCEACQGTELARLAAQFRAVRAAAKAPGVAEPAPGYSPRELDWADSRTGFGMPQPAAAQSSEPHRGWLSRLLDR